YFRAPAGEFFDGPSRLFWQRAALAARFGDRSRFDRARTRDAGDGGPGPRARRVSEGCRRARRRVKRPPGPNTSAGEEPTAAGSGAARTLACSGGHVDLLGLGRARAPRARCPSAVQPGDDQRANLGPLFFFGGLAPRVSARSRAAP